jgi:hypothetical protein
MDRYGNVNFIRDIFIWLKNKGEKDIFLFKRWKCFQEFLSGCILH